MAEFNHTPGPWEVDYDGDSLEIIIAKGRKPVEVIAHLKLLAKGPPGEERANADLIAAAPDLLKACELFVRFPETDSGECFDVAAEAIAKAKGEEADPKRKSTEPKFRATIFTGLVAGSSITWRGKDVDIYHSILDMAMHGKMVEIMFVEEPKEKP